jgi:hypothetical protein
MARIRTIKPDFWTDGNIVALSPFARLLYIGMWNFTMCDHGHVADDAMKLKLQVLPMDDIDIVALLSELLDSERVTRVVDPEGRTYLHVTRFEDHQKIDPRWKTRCSACTHRDSLTLAETHPSLDVAHPNSPKLPLGRDGMGRDGKGKDKETAPRKRGARLSDDWNPSESLNVAMTEERPDIDLTAELRIFRDYWIAQPGQRGVKTDWDATWRNWIRRARPTVRPGALQNGISRQDAKVNGYLAYANLDNQKEIS